GGETARRTAPGRRARQRTGPTTAGAAAWTRRRAVRRCGRRLAMRNVFPTLLRGTPRREGRWRWHLLGLAVGALAAARAMPTTRVLARHPLCLLAQPAAEGILRTDACRTDPEALRERYAAAAGDLSLDASIQVARVLLDASAAPAGSELAAGGGE